MSDEIGQKAAPDVVFSSLPSTRPESVELLDGGEHAYPRMLQAIEQARVRIHLEVYAFALSGVGIRFVEALRAAAEHGVQVTVVIDGWGSARGGRAIEAALRQSGCEVRIYNPLTALLLGRIGRNHRKILLVDDEVAYLGGINIGDEYSGDGDRPGWADLALEIHGPQCAHLGRMIRHEKRKPVGGRLRILLSRLGGGWRLRRRYIRAFARARNHIDLAHGYFIPDRGVVHALTTSARRGVTVRLLLAGRSDVPFARAATHSLYRKLIAAGVSIHEWNDSVLHAKVATVDGRRLLVGSFNLDPFSMANLETLVEVSAGEVVKQGEAWIKDRFDRSRVVTAVETASAWQTYFVEPVGRMMVRLADAFSRILADRRRRHPSKRHAALPRRHGIAPVVTTPAGEHPAHQVVELEHHRARRTPAGGVRGVMMSSARPPHG